MKSVPRNRLFGMVLILLGILCMLPAYHLFRDESSISPLLVSCSLVLPILGILMLITGHFPLMKVAYEFKKLTPAERTIVITGGSRLLVLVTLPFPAFVALGLGFLLSGADRGWYVWLFTLACIPAGVLTYRACQRYVQKNAKYGPLFRELLRVAQGVSIVAGIVLAVVIYSLNTQ